MLLYVTNHIMLTNKIFLLFCHILSTHVSVINALCYCVTVLHCGVPQGSILGPMLFIIINYLPQSVFNSRFSLYADDTVTYCRGECVDTVTINLMDDLSRGELWLNANKLSLDVNKTKGMLFSSQFYRGDQLLSLTMLNTPIE